jgi:hypothetical protein
VWVVRSSISVIRQLEQEEKRPLSLAEVVGVHPLHLVGALQRYAHAVVDHEVGERLPVDQDHLVRESFGVLDGAIGEVGGGDEDTFLGCEINPASVGLLLALDRGYRGWIVRR